VRIDLIRPGRAPAVALGVTTLIAAIAPTAVTAATLGAIRVDPSANGGSVVTVSFVGGAPTFHVVGSGTSDPSILLDGTTVSPQAPTQVTGAGSVTSVSVAPSGSAATLQLHLGGTATVSVRGTGNQLFVSIAATVPPAGRFRGLGAAQPGFGAGFAAPPPAVPAGDTVVVPLKYADVSEIAGILVAGSSVPTNDTFSPLQTNIGTSSLGGGSFGGGLGGGGGFGGGFSGGSFSGSSFPQQQPQQNFGAFGAGAVGLAQRLNENVAIDRRLNAIILTGPPEVIAPIEAMIDKIDIPVPSVMLETQIVELTDSASKAVGLDLADQNGIIATTANGASSSTTTSGSGFQIGTGRIPSASVTFNATLYAQIQRGNGRVLSKPRILAQSGQPASILTGDAIPIFTSVIATGAAALTSQQVNYVNVGVNLQIQPRVSSDGYVTSHIYSEVSSVTQYVQGTPQISQRSASTIATVRDGESFVIGGLLQDNELQNLSKLPLIGDLPIIGGLFRHVTTSKTQTNLYIVVTPHIIGLANAPAPPPKGFPITLPSPLPQSSVPPAPPTYMPAAPGTPSPTLQPLPTVRR